MKFSILQLALQTQMEHILWICYWMLSNSDCEEESQKLQQKDSTFKKIFNLWEGAIDGKENNLSPPNS